MCYGSKIYGCLKKKTLFLLLSGALLFFVLFLCSNSYAREVSSIDIANSIYNIHKAANNVELTKNDINLTICDLISNRFNNHQGRYCIFQYLNGSIIEFYYFDGDGKIYMTSSNAPYCRTGTYSIRYSLQTKQFLENTFINATSEPYGTYTYNDGIIYTASNSNNIYWNANTMRPRGFNMFEETLFIDDYFTFNYNINLNNITIEDFDVVKQVTSDYHGHNLADFGRTTHLRNVVLTYWKYEKERGYFEPIVNKSVNSYIIINEDLGELYFTYDMFIPNTIMDFGLVSNDLENFESLSLFFYCVDSNTVIDSNGDLDLNNTFDDDYYIKYTNLINNILNQNKGNITTPSGDISGSVDFTPITDSINSLTDSSEVDSVLDGYSTSGEILGLMNYQNYGSGEHRYFSAPVTYLFDSISNVLTSSGDVYFDIPLRNGTSKRIYSKDFYVPENGFKAFVRIFMIFSVIFTIYNHFKILIEDVNAGDGFKSLKRESVDTNIIHM